MDPTANPAELARSLWDWLLAVGVAAGVLALLLAARGLLARRLARAAATRAAAPIVDLLRALLGSTWTLFFVVLALYAGALTLDLGEATLAAAGKALTLATFAQAAAWGMAVLDRLLLARRGHAETHDGAGTPLSAAAFLGRAAIVVVFALLALDNLGVQVSTLIAGLGITSIAVALALQAVLSDLFASLSIYFDKPFEVGDSIAVDDLQGTVESVGMRTTRLRSVSGEQIVIGNRDLLDSRIRNYKRMRERRAVMTFAVATGVEPRTLAEVPRAIAETIEAKPNARFDRAHLTGVKDGAFVFESVYYMRVPDYAAFMDTQQAIYLELYERFDAMGVEFAYPMQRVIGEGPTTQSAVTAP